MKACVLALAATLLLGACATDPAVTTGTGARQVGDGDLTVERSDAAEGDCAATADADHPDVVAVDAELVGPRTLEVAATPCSAYDTPERYADAWRVRTPDGEELAVRELLHDHAGEQPFTRSLSSPVEVPEGVDVDVVEGRDRANGWGGTTLEVRLGG